MLRSDMIEIIDAENVSIDEGQRVLVCKVESSDIVSRRTGKKMGKKEMVITSGVIKKIGGRNYMISAHSQKTPKVGIDDAQKISKMRDIPRISLKRPSDNRMIYAKLIQE